jgi:hypothetical protein
MRPESAEEGAEQEDVLGHCKELSFGGREHGSSGRASTCLASAKP